MKCKIHIAATRLKMLGIFLLLFSTAVMSQHSGVRVHLPMISAHRGDSRVAPENTILAFTKAIEAGADFIEIDVRTTSDGAQIIMHDGSLKRTTALDKKVDAVSLAEIRKLSAGGKEYQNEKVPTLEEVCQLVQKTNKRGGRVKLYVDSKVIRAEEVVRILKQYHVLDSAVFYGSVKTLTEIRKIHKAARVMPSFPAKDDLTSVVNQLQPYAFDVSFDELNRDVIQTCHDNGIKVFSDLLGEDDTPLAYRNAVELGVDLIQTDDVSAVKTVLKEFE